MNTEKIPLDAGSVVNARAEERMAAIEGLQKHLESVTIRFERGDDGAPHADSGDPT